MSERSWILALTGLLIVTSLVLYLVPQIDPAVSRLFWNGHDFILAKGEPASILNDLQHYGLRGVFFVYAIAVPLWLLYRKAAMVAWRRYLFVVLSVALAAGLVTNVILKDHWGRARPNQLIEFGGTASFTPAWVISDQCFKNCSFVGGDVSFAACSLAPALAARRRRRWVAGSIMLTMLITLSRLAAGGHFLSDCLLAGLMTWVIVLILKRTFISI